MQRAVADPQVEDRWEQMSFPVKVVMFVLLQGKGVNQRLMKESPRYCREASPSCRNNQKHGCFVHPDQTQTRKRAPPPARGGFLNGNKTHWGKFMWGFGKGFQPGFRTRVLKL